MIAGTVIIWDLTKSTAPRSTAASTSVRDRGLSDSKIYGGHCAPLAVRGMFAE